MLACFKARSLGLMDRFLGINQVLLENVGQNFLAIDFGNIKTFFLHNKNFIVKNINKYF